MYRKILFISLNLFQDVSINTKAIILLFFSLFSLLITFSSSPFLTRELNYLEVFSNISALLIIFSGCIYLNGDSILMKSTSYLMIFAINFIFSLFWIISILNIFLEAYESVLKERFPKFYFSLLKLIDFVKKYLIFKNDKTYILRNEKSAKIFTKIMNIK